MMDSSSNTCWSRLGRAPAVNTATSVLALGALSLACCLLVSAPPDGAYLDYARKIFHSEKRLEDYDVVLNDTLSGIALVDYSIERDGGGVALLPTLGYLAPSRMVALMGSSGCGKSTLLRGLMSTLAENERGKGHIMYNQPAGARCLTDATRKRAIRLVPQEDVMHGDLTVFENVYAAAATKLGSASDEAVRDLVVGAINSLEISAQADVRVGSPADMHLAHLSGGQKKRVNLAMEMVADPAVLFIDEPTSGLDSATGNVIVGVIREIARTGSKIALATIHSPPITTFELFDDLILMAAPGKVLYWGPRANATRYFASVGWGEHVGKYLNPAELFVDIASGRLAPTTAETSTRMPKGAAAVTHAHTMWERQCKRAMEAAHNGKKLGDNYCWNTARDAYLATAKQNQCVSGGTGAIREYLNAAVAPLQQFPTLLWRSRQLITFADHITWLTVIVISTMTAILLYNSPASLPVAFAGMPGAALSRGSSMIAAAACLQLLQVEKESKMLQREFSGDLSVLSLFAAKMICGLAIGFQTQLGFHLFSYLTYMTMRWWKKEWKNGVHKGEGLKPRPQMYKSLAAMLSFVAGHIINHCVVQGVVMCITALLPTSPAYFCIQGYFVFLLVANDLSEDVGEWSNAYHLGQLQIGLQEDPRMPGDVPGALTSLLQLAALFNALAYALLAASTSGNQILAWALVVYVHATMIDLPSVEDIRDADVSRLGLVRYVAVFGFTAVCIHVGFIFRTLSPVVAAGVITALSAVTTFSWPRKFRHSPEATAMLLLLCVIKPLYFLALGNITLPPWAYVWVSRSQYLMLGTLTVQMLRWVTGHLGVSLPSAIRYRLRPANKLLRFFEAAVVLAVVVGPIAYDPAVNAPATLKALSVWPVLSLMLTFSDSREGDAVGAAGTAQRRTIFQTTRQTSQGTLKTE